jgi:hypothetical protein
VHFLNIINGSFAIPPVNAVEERSLNSDDPALKNFVTSLVQWYTPCCHIPVDFDANDILYRIHSWNLFMTANSTKLGFKFIPMPWGPKMEADFVKLASQNANSGWVASFNKPDQTGPSNEDPYHAAQIICVSLTPSLCRASRSSPLLLLPCPVTWFG